MSAKMTSAALVFFGGGIGSVLRYLTGLGATRLMGEGWPYGTFAVNLLGCLAMGLCFRLLPAAEIGQPSARLLLMTGVLGGFTTFSAFALDAAQLWLRQETAGLMFYLFGSVTFSLVGVAAGLAIGKALAP
ncbi:MAG: fluoride efflux transporter CrcB [Beijerinckiaceae bacterium]